MLNQDKKIIASLVSSPMFEALVRIIESRIDVLRNDSVKRETEFETIYKLGKQDGGRDELRNLIIDLETIYKKYKEEK